LETHDVDASLKEKLKCLVFIPIISRTYCDPKSFAWEHEFKAFVDQASRDQFGLKVKLPGGNVASRILPIRIYDLDNTDIKLCETVLGGVLRGIKFIYAEPGVNRPLKPNDDEKINLNKTKYRNQINKVGNAIKEIISGLKTEPVELGKEKILHIEPSNEVHKEQVKETQEKPFRSVISKLFPVILITTILIIAAILAYPKIFKRDKLANLRSSDGRISIAVMPFQNMTNDTLWNVWQDGIQNELITSLTNSEELKVRQFESISNLLQSEGFTNYASLTPSVAGKISQKLDASVFIYGTIKQAGATIRLNAQLIDSKTEEAFKYFEINGPAKEDMIFQIIDSLKRMIKNSLIISKLGKELSPDFRSFASSNSPEAYRYYIYGQKAFFNRDYPIAVKMYSQAITIDSNFFSAIVSLSVAYGEQGFYDQAKKWGLKIHEIRDQMPAQLKIYADWASSMYLETPLEEIKYLKQILERDDQLPIFCYELGRVYNRLYQYDKAIPELEKALEIYKKWGSKPMWALNYILLGHAYHKTDQYKKEGKLYKKAEQDFPDDPAIIYRQAILSLTEGDTVTANRYIENYKSIRKENSASKAMIESGIAGIYSEAGILYKAEESYRQAISSSPKNPYWKYSLAYFLIDKDRNINEGLALADTLLKISADNYNYLHTKGWGLYKLGKYEEALELLVKSDSLKPIYNHALYLHIQEVKTAIANKK
jgi:tetratricopeptide (TPR) repeat protein